MNDGSRLVRALAMGAVALCAGVWYARRRRNSERDASLLPLRRALFASNLSISYGSDPLTIVRGRGTYLYDENGREYLDCVNNVAQVGHCHKKVTAAACRQLAEINTNTRYLHPARVAYAEKLLATFEPELDVLFLTCSGSEANDLALRLARAFTGRYDVLVLGSAYHGHTTAMIECSPYKFEGAGGFPQRSHVHQVPVPDTYRGVHRTAPGDDAAAAAAGAAYAAFVAKKCREVAEKAEMGTNDGDGDGRGVACMFAESIPGCAGQIVPPPGFLRAAFEAVRAAGGVCIADEVQVGFGRVGSAFWAYQAQGARPDIVTLGKPMGNGFAVAGVVTTRAIADAFANGEMEYFNTFGGSTAACAVGSAVLDAIRDDRLQENALHVGARLQASLRDLAEMHATVGDVRGMGLFLGVELVADRMTRAPDGALAAAVALRCRRAGVLVSTDGPHHNVVKIKPPLCFSDADAARLVAALDVALQGAER